MKQRFEFYFTFLLFWLVGAGLLKTLDRFLINSTIVGGSATWIALAAVSRTISLALYADSALVYISHLSQREIFLRSFYVAIFDVIMTVLLVQIFLSISNWAWESLDIVFAVVMIITIINGPLVFDKMLISKIFGYSQNEINN